MDSVDVQNEESYHPKEMTGSTGSWYPYIAAQSSIPMLSTHIPSWTMILSLQMSEWLKCLRNSRVGSMSNIQGCHLVHSTCRYALVQHSHCPAGCLGFYHLTPVMCTHLFSYRWLIMQKWCGSWVGLLHSIIYYQISHYHHKHFKLHIMLP